MSDQTGGAKKFLYTGPKKGNDDEDDDVPWNFNSSRSQKQTTGAQKFELDGAWSIRNMNVGGGSKAPKSDGLTYNANNKYYSRHSGAAKDKDDFNSFLDGVNAKSNATTGGSDQGGKMWSVGNQASRRPFTYTYGSEHVNPTDQFVTPRNVSNSSTGMYPQTDNSMYASQTGSGMNSGNSNSFRGGNHMNSDHGNGFSNQGITNNTSNNSVFNKSIMSTNNGASNSFNPTSRNSLFNSSQMNAGLLGTGSKRPNNKSLW